MHLFAGKNWRNSAKLGWKHEKGTAQTMIWHYLKYEVKLPERLK